MSRPDKQMNVPIRTRNNEEVQTDVNLMGVSRVSDTHVVGTSPHFLEFSSQSWMLPFSDYYLLGQLSNVIEQIRVGGQDSRTSRVVDELTAKIHGLLARELKVTTRNGGYYDILLEQEKQLIKTEIKFGNVDRKIEGYLKRIEQLEREVQSLRGSLKLYQGSAEENQLYKGFFRDLKESTSKKSSDFEKLLNEQILPKIRQFEVSLAEISKNSSRDRSSKHKAAISRYAQELDSLSKAKDLDWQTLSNSAAVFFTSLEHLNEDDWIQERLALSSSYQELKTRHIALASLVEKNVNELLKKDVSFKNFSEVSQLIRALEGQKEAGYQTSIVNGWVGLGLIHHNHNHLVNIKGTGQVEKLRSLVSLFQRQIKVMTEKYPQLNETISSSLREFLTLQIANEIVDGSAIDWIKQILVRETEVIHVDNVYRYYSKTDKQSNYYLRILVKSLIEQLKRITKDHKIAIELDEGILELLKGQILDGVNINDIIGLFRPSARVCQVEVIVQKPTYLTTTETVGVPLRQEKAIIVSDTAHFAVNLQQGVPYRKEIPYEYSKTQVVQVPVRLELPYAVPTKIVEEVIKYEDKVQLVKIPVDQDKFIQVIQETVINANEQVLVPEQIVREIQVPYLTSKVETRQIEVEREVSKNIYKEISKVFKVEQVVPKVYKEPKFQIVDRPVHHVVVQKEIQFVQIQKPIVQRVQVAKIVEVLVQKPIYNIDHCDCQKPQAVIVEIEKAVYKQVPKEIIIEKCHFIQPNVEERIVEIPCHTQVPLYKQVIRQEPVIVERAVPLRTVEEKLVIVDRQIPFFVQHFTPVQLIVQKPVIVRDIKHVPVEVEQPVPVYIERVVPKIVEVFRDRIIEKIVQVPRVEIIERIVEKIVTIPRIVERIVTVTQFIQVPVFIQTPVLQIIQVPVERLVVDIQEREKIVEVKTEVLKIETVHQLVERVQYEQVKKIIQIEPESYPQLIVEKIVRVIEERPVEIYIDRFVDRVIQIKDVIPVEQRVQIPIEVQVPVEIITQKPFFYQQPIVQIDVQRVEREKVVELYQEVIKLERIETPIIQIQKEIVHIPGETIILREPELHIIQIEKEIVITANDVQERPVDHYLDIQKAHVIDQQTFVVPQKEVCYLQKPYAVTIEKPVRFRHEEMIVVERPETLIVKTREGLNEQIVKVVQKERLTAQRQSYPEPIPVPQHHYHIVYEELPPKTSQKSVLVVDQKVRTTEVINTIEVQDTNRQIITREIEVPIYMQRIFEKILMLPQIVEVQKKIFMVEEINNLIAKEVSLEVHQQQYRGQIRLIQTAVNQILTLISSNRQTNTADLKKKLTLFLELLRVESRIPKIVETIKEVEVIRERDRPVLVPVFDSSREKVLHLIVHDLIEGLKGLNKQQIEKRFSERVRNLLAADLGFDGYSEVNLEQFVPSKIEVEGKWKYWLDNYGGDVPNVRPGVQVTDAENLFLVGYNSNEADFATLQASLQKSFLVQKQRQFEIQNLKSEYGNQIDQLKVRLNELETLLATEKYYKDFYLNELIKIKKMLEDKQFDHIQQILATISHIKEEVITGRVVQTVTTTRVERVSETIEGDDRSRRIDQLFSQLAAYQGESHDRNRQTEDLRHENERLRQQIDDIKLNIPAWSREGASDDLRIAKVNQDWSQKISGLEQNHFIEINHLREQLMKQLSSTAQGTQQGGSNEEFTNIYNDLMSKYTTMTQNQRNAENQKRELFNSYEEKVKQLNKELLSLRRDNENILKKNESERNRLIDQYERRLTSTSSNQQKEQRKQLETLRRNYDNLELRNETQRKKIVDDYQRRLTSTQGSQGNQERQLRRQLEDAKRNLENSDRKYANQKKKIVDDYESKLNQKTRQFQQTERKLKLLQDELERLKSSSSSKKISSPGQVDELNSLRDKIRKLEIELDGSKKQIETYQKSRLGQTAYTSGITSGVKHSGFEGEFQSPQGRYKSGGNKFEQVAESGSRESEKGESRSSEVEARRISKSGVRSDREREEGEDVRSQSSRVSGISESSPFKSTMTMKQFMDVKKTEEKDQIITLVMIKVIQKIQQQADKGIINSYSPSNIFLSNFNPSNLESLIVRFGAPITNRKNKTDGIYLSPEVLKGEGTTLKSVVFTIAVIWDELIHYESYYKSIDQIENLAYEYKVRDTSLNPILRNTLFQMMSKEPNKRLELGEAKRRLSLQRYIVSQGRSGTATSKVSTQSRRNQ